MSFFVLRFLDYKAAISPFSYFKKIKVQWYAMGCLGTIVVMSELPISPMQIPKSSLYAYSVAGKPKQHSALQLNPKGNAPAGTSAGE